MRLRLVCPVEEATFEVEGRSAAEVEGREIRCPVCRRVHVAILAPEAPEEAPRHAPRPLVPVKGVVLATFLGSFLAGGIVIAINLVRMGRRAGAVAAIGCGLVATGVVVGLALGLPETFPGPLLWLPQLLVAWLVARGLFEEPLAERADAGVPPGSVLPAVLVGLAVLVVGVAGVFGWAMLTPPFPGERIVRGEAEVYCGVGTDAADADRLVEALHQVGFLGDGREKTLAIERSGGAWVVSFVLVEEAWQREDVRAAFRDLGEQLAEHGFSRPLHLRLCDEAGDVQRTLEVA